MRIKFTEYENSNTSSWVYQKSNHSLYINVIIASHSSLVERMYYFRNCLVLRTFNSVFILIPVVCITLWERGIRDIKTHRICIGARIDTSSNYTEQLNDWSGKRCTLKNFEKYFLSETAITLTIRPYFNFIKFFFNIHTLQFQPFNLIH